MSGPNSLTSLRSWNTRSSFLICEPEAKIGSVLTPGTGVPEVLMTTTSESLEKCWAQRWTCTLLESPMTQSLVSSPAHVKTCGYIEVCGAVSRSGGCRPSTLPPG